MWNNLETFTFTLPADLLQQAKVFAAEHDTTVNALVRELLQEKLSREQRKLFEELRDTLPVENQPSEKSLLGKVKDYFM